jgi:hypothetical protein
MEANLNEYVWVRLTEEGHVTYYDFYLNLGVDPPSLDVFRVGSGFKSGN